MMRLPVSGPVEIGATAVAGIRVKGVASWRKALLQRGLTVEGALFDEFLCKRASVFIKETKQA